MTHDASHSYTYDAENRITKVDGGSTATYGYDVDGRRVSRVVAGVETDYIYDLSGRVVADYGGGCGATCWRVGYVYLNGEAVAEYFGGTYFVHSDHLGSTRLLTGYPTASVVECDDYYPFGEQTSCGGTSTTTHKFTGYERDAESGLDNAQARYNSSSLGRFMSPDPIGNFVADATNPQTWNMYAYVNNNPLAFVDPTGTEGCEWSAASICEADNNLGDFGDGSLPVIISITICGLICLGDLSTPPPDPSGCSPFCSPVPPVAGGGGGCYYALANPCGGSSPGTSNPGTPQQTRKPQGLKYELCVQAAYDKRNNTDVSLLEHNTFLPVRLALRGALISAVTGCIWAIEGGCVEGAVPGAIVGGLGGVILGVGEGQYDNIVGYRKADRQLKKDIAACTQ